MTLVELSTTAIKNWAIMQVIAWNLKKTGFDLSNLYAGD